MHNTQAKVWIATLATILATVVVVSGGWHKPSDTAVKQPSTQTPAVTYPAQVYFSRHPASDDDPSKVFALKRTSFSQDAMSYVVQQLLVGPTSSETTDGYFSQVRLRGGDSTCGGPDFTVAVNNGVAWLRFCKTFDHLGVVADGQAETAIKATLSQFSNVKKVVILDSKNSCEFDLSGMNLCMR